MPRPSSMASSSLLLGAVLLLISACAYPAPRGSMPLYAMDTTWFNDPIGGIGPWKEADRGAAMRAARDRQARWERAGRARAPRVRARGGSPRSLNTGVVSVAAGAPESPRARSDSRGRKNWRERRRNRRARQLASARGQEQRRVKAPLTHIAPMEEPKSPKKPKSGLLLGDGTVPEELVIAAQRVVGIRDGLVGPAFMRHVLTVAAIEGAELEAAEIWKVLKADGRGGLDPTEAERGDLAFFRETHDLDGDGRADRQVTMAAIVERNRGGGSLVCIGEVHGEVIRFVVTPGHPDIRRSEAEGVELNAPLRFRSLGDEADAPLWSGQLFVGLGRVH